MKLSVIVPVYKAEAYLEKCVDSLLNQSLRDMEIILVNDGSPDGSQAIIDRYAAACPEKIRSLTLSNGGQGRARNRGMELAKGEFLGFVDSDDWVHEDMFRKLVGVCEEQDADVAVCAIQGCYDDGHTDLQPGWREGEPLSSAGSSSNKVFRRSAVGDIRFPEGLWYEDFGFSAKILLAGGKAVYVPEPLYYYRCGQPSTMHNQNARKNLDMLEIMEDLNEFIGPEGDREGFAYLLINHVLLDSINRLACQSGREKNEVIFLMRAYVHRCLPRLRACRSFRRESRNRRIVMWLNYWGLERLSRLLLRLKKAL